MNSQWETGQSDTSTRMSRISLRRNFVRSGADHCNHPELGIDELEKERTRRLFSGATQRSFSLIPEMRRAISRGLSELRSLSTGTTNRSGFYRSLRNCLESEEAKGSTMRMTTASSGLSDNRQPWGLSADQEVLGISLVSHLNNLDEARWEFKIRALVAIGGKRATQRGASSRDLESESLFNLPAREETSCTLGVVSLHPQ